MPTFVFCLFGTITHAFSQTLPSLFKLFQTLPEVARVWTAAVRCPQCAYPNDKTFNFCQQCGYRLENLVGAPNESKSTSTPLTHAWTRWRLVKKTSLTKNRSLAFRWSLIISYFLSLHLKPLCPHRPLISLCF